MLSKDAMPLSEYRSVYQSGSLTLNSMAKSLGSIHPSKVSLKDGRRGKDQG